MVRAMFPVPMMLMLLMRCPVRVVGCAVWLAAVAQVMSSNFM
jgi:hypothetical protein